MSNIRFTDEARKAPQSIGSKLGRIGFSYPSTGGLMSKAHRKLEITGMKSVARYVDVESVPVMK